MFVWDTTVVTITQRRGFVVTTSMVSVYGHWNPPAGEKIPTGNQDKHSEGGNFSISPCLIAPFGDHYLVSNTTRLW